MIERLIFQALAEGIQDFVADPDFIIQFLTVTRQIEKEEAISAAEKFVKDPPGVIHHYAREDSRFPLLSIVLLSESESTKFLNDEGPGFIGHDSGFETPFYGANDMSSIYTKSYGIFSYSEHPDVCRYNYEIAKYLLTRARPFFMEMGVLDTQFSGADIAPDTRYIPAHLFARMLTMQTQKEECVVGQFEQRAFKIGGIHFDGGGLGSPTPIGVEASVTVSEE